MGTSWWFLLVAAIIATGAAAIVFELPPTSKFVLEATSWQKWIFVVWTIAGPLWLLWDWDQNLPNLAADKIAQFQYRQKLISDLWGAGALVFGVFWGLKKLRDIR